MMKRIGTIISLALMTLCPPVSAADGTPEAPASNMPPPMEMGPTGQIAPKTLVVPEHIQLDRDLLFDTIDGHELKLDIAYPKKGKEKLPAIVYIHGGGWEMGDKPTDRTLFFAENGFVCVAVQYRLSGVAKFPAAVHDCKTAIRWTRANAEKYGIDSDKIGVIGESAGGHLAALMGTSGGDTYLEGGGPHGEYSSSVQAVVDLFGPTDFARMAQASGTIDHDAADSPESKFLGKPVREVPELVKKANPITYIDAEDPPTLMIHGENDNLVPVQQSELLYSALTQAGVRARLVRVKNAGHGFSPSTQGAVVSPRLEEIEALEVQWFRDVFGMSYNEPMR